MLPFKNNFFSIKTKTMLTKILYVFISIVSLNTLIAQHTITGQLKPKGQYRLMLLYKAEGAFQYYKASSNIDSTGLFGFALPENFETGAYRLVYDTEKNQYVNIIYNNEDISFVFDPKDLINTISFYDSKENTLFFDYVRTINYKYMALDSVHKEYFKNPNEANSELYKIKKGEVDIFQNYFEKESEGKLANHYIKAFKKHISDTPLNTKKEYYNVLKENYLNSINIKDSVLRNSSFILDRLIEYVFDLNELTARINNTKLDVKMIDKALKDIEPSKFRDEIIYSLTSSAFDPYLSTYDNLLDYIYRNYYVNLPATSKTESFTQMVKLKLNAIVGKKAPMINFDNGNLYSIQEDTTFIVFWSTTCSHCLEEVPKIYDAISNRKNVKMIMVGLEEVYSDWETVSANFPKAIQKRANGKWKNKHAISYNVKGTPAYFLLDKNKKIIAKPNDVKAINSIFNVNIPVKHKH